MIPLRKLDRYAKMKEDENIEFRTWLKIHAEPKDLDKRFYRLHHELFANYDCSRCRNCCKKYKCLIPKDEVEKDAQILGMTAEEFKEAYLDLTIDVSEDGFNTRNCPCDFLEENGNCLLGDHKPENCVKYPYTDQPDRLGSMYSFLTSVSICPVAYEICERLKEEYGFKK